MADWSPLRSAKRRKPPPPGRHTLGTESSHFVSGAWHLLLAPGLTPRTQSLAPCGSTGSSRIRPSHFRGSSVTVLLRCLAPPDAPPSPAADRYPQCMRYAVTGAAGFIGSQLSETLIAAGDEVVGIDCFTDYYDPALKEENARGLDIRRLDLAEDELDFAGFDGVFHLAGQPGVRSFGDIFPIYLRRNVLASQRVFEAAARDHVKVVFASSSSVYGAADRYPTPEDAAPHPRLPTASRSSPASTLHTPTGASSGSTASSSATSTRSARASCPTWPSPGSCSRSPKARRSSSSATVASHGAGPTSQTSSPARSQRCAAAPGRTTWEERSRRR